MTLGIFISFICGAFSMWLGVVVVRPRVIKKIPPRTFLGLELPPHDDPRWKKLNGDLVLGPVVVQLPSHGIADAYPVLVDGRDMAPEGSGVLKQARQYRDAVYTAFQEQLLLKAMIDDD